MLYDKKNREIMLGDVLKVFHFRTSKRVFYMYKHVIDEVVLGKENTHYFKLSHLSRNKDEYCLLVKDGSRQVDIEIVQGFSEVDGVLLPYYERPTRRH